MRRIIEGVIVGLVVVFILKRMGVKD